MYKSINTAENPELKEKVLDGTLFLWKCPSCGQTNIARYEVLYHDPDKKLMVWVLPDNDLSETQMHSVSLHAKAIGDYTLRRVEDMGSLIEKISIRDAGLNDIAVEMCKYVTKLEIASRLEDKETAEEFCGKTLRFYGAVGSDGPEAITFMYPDSGKMAGMNIGFNVYEDCMGILQRNPALTPEDGFAKIDAGWILAKMK